LNTYEEIGQIAPKLKKIAKIAPVRFLHGYPSILYEFALFCDEHDHELRQILRKSLKGAFLGSEYPHSLFRNKIENVFEIDTVNWYGHTEGAVLAYEKKEKFRYYPFHTYGFVEISDEGHLMASSYYNKASPFIRYDTEDIISDAEIKNGFLISFCIKDGRNGEYVTDKNGKKISLTALIFGRHHRLFDFCSHIQICQKNPGQAVVFWVPKDKNMELEPGSLFDSSNIRMDFAFRRLYYPIKTKAGKLNLLINPDQLGDYE
jgi:phenylacetate-CoA ligase